MVYFIWKLLKEFLNIFINRYMFFFDNDFNFWIEKVFLDGWDRVVIIYKGFLRVFIFIVDFDNKKLYWVDYGRYILEGCDYDGVNRRVIRCMNLVFIIGLIYF